MGKNFMSALFYSPNKSATMNARTIFVQLTLKAFIIKELCNRGDRHKTNHNHTLGDRCLLLNGDLKEKKTSEADLLNV